MTRDGEHGTAPVEAVRDYWQAHTLGQQYVSDASIPVGSREYFAHIRPWMNPYKFPEILPRIEREAERLRGKRLLELGCGMGFDSIEWLKRGVRVTVTDLTPAAVELARRNLEHEGLVADDVRVENALDLGFPDAHFDGVWACGVLHHTGDMPRALREIRRVLRPGGRAIVSHLYRRPSWMWAVSRLGREPIEFRDGDPPVTEFLTEREALARFRGAGLRVIEAVPDHWRALPIARTRTGWKAALYRGVFRPVYNLLPAPLAKKLAYKLSVTALRD